MHSRIRLTMASMAMGLGLIVAPNAHASVAYTYDLSGRLTTAIYDNGLCIAYLYDANGNRLSQVNTSGGGPVSPVWGTGKWGCFVWTP
jgi:YD repeat-containing protein